MLLEELEPILPLHFFKINTSVHKLVSDDRRQKLSSKYLLGNFSEMLEEEPFADVYMGWHHHGILFSFDIKEEFQDCFYPDYHKGDAVEILIDTKGLTSSHMNRHCHHFFFLPKQKEEKQYEEITKLRYENQRPLASDASIHLQVEFKSNSYQMRIFLTKDALYGYNPAECDKLLLQFIIYRHKQPPQHFCFSKKQFKSMLNPSLWANVQLKDAR
ncbi:MAG: hypothetical protein HY860_01600 [Chlamydiales bacterium]|nr:hypothetical protein [Chlamydiales bacterium]